MVPPRIWSLRHAVLGDSSPGQVGETQGRRARLWDDLVVGSVSRAVVHGLADAAF